MAYVNLSEIADIMSGLRIDRYMKKNTKMQKVYRISSPKSVGNSLAIDYIEISSNIDDKYYSKRDDILLSMTRPTYIFKVKEEGVIIHSNFVILRVKEEYDSSYVYHSLKSEFNHIMHILGEGSVLGFVRVSNLREINLNLPDLETQKKYGKLWDLIDEKIRLNEKKVLLENNLKRGIIKEEIGENYVRLQKPTRK
ncbi:restriction endonuclease subunit S [uncultured Methanobrevibacter sp.]|uniref:restriction endonuclease subunit S n=1 Tax=uncultured Methanobrevibacter sp. TaxID=253161 RepID=UPI00258FDC1B|nr:restriction endonuclease subunit S [uncultured Methanobrevibacter sp.]